MNRFALSLRDNPTEAEQRLWNPLRACRLSGFKFRRQRPFRLFVCDFNCLEASVIIELAGSQHAQQVSCDQNRDDFMRAYGF